MPAGGPKLNRNKASQDVKKQDNLDTFLKQLESGLETNIKGELGALKVEIAQTIMEKLGLPAGSEMDVTKEYADKFKQVMKSLTESGEKVGMDQVEGVTIIHVDETTDIDVLEMKVEPLLSYYEMTIEDGMMQFTNQEGELSIVIALDRNNEHNKKSKNRKEKKDKDKLDGFMNSLDIRNMIFVMDGATYKIQGYGSSGVSYRKISEQEIRDPKVAREYKTYGETIEQTGISGFNNVDIVYGGIVSETSVAFQEFISQNNISYNGEMLTGDEPITIEFYNYQLSKALGKKPTLSNKELGSRSIDVNGISLASTKNFDELYDYLDKVGGLQGSQLYYPAIDLKKIIHDVSIGKRELTQVTRTEGLRDKVEGFINAGLKSYLNISRDVSSIAETKNFDEVYYYLDKVKGLRGTEQYYTSYDLSRIIHEVSLGKRRINEVTRTEGLRDKIEEFINLGLESDYKQTETVKLVDEIKDTKNLTELLKYLEDKGGIQGSTMFYSFGSLEDTIHHVIYNDGDLDLITRTDGLRDKVEELRTLIEYNKNNFGKEVSDLEEFSKELLSGDDLDLKKKTEGIEGLIDANKNDQSKMARLQKTLDDVVVGIKKGGKKTLEKYPNILRRVEGLRAMVVFKRFQSAYKMREYDLAIQYGNKTLEFVNKYPRNKTKTFIGYFNYKTINQMNTFKREGYDFDVLSTNNYIHSIGPGGVIQFLRLDKHFDFSNITDLKSYLDAYRKLSPNILSQLNLTQKKAGNLNPKVASQVFEKRKGMLESFCELSKRDYQKLFFKKNEENFEHSVKQANVGNCYLIAALQAMRKSPHFSEIIRTSIKVEDYGRSVKIPMGVKNGERITISPKDIGLTWNKSYFKKFFKDGNFMRPIIMPVGGPIGIKILEAAYTKKVNNGEMDRLNTEGGWSDQASQLLLGENVSLVDHINRGVEKNPGEIIKFYEALKHVDFEKHLVYMSTKGHAYTLESIDLEKNEIIVVNPHHTGRKTKYTIEQCIEKFIRFKVVKFNYAKMFTDFVS